MRKWCLVLLFFLGLSGLCGCTNSIFDQGSVSEESSDVQSGTILPDFNAVDLEGNPVSNDVFGQAELTMINIWGTFCGPCINEMPDIQRLQEYLQDKNVQVIGIVADQKLEDARVITAAQGVTYLNLMPDRSLIDSLLSKFDYVPVTVFVDSEGRLLDTVISGSRDYDSYLQTIEEVLAGQQG